ncbi:MbtH family protein [Streptomyces sp. NPDC051000]|uniref:MbtH family protein n=1 Tax=unclassified Streptomyces TaxID=2593676 RepID=UPI0033C01460
MTNPFDDPDRLFRVLRNAGGEHSLWPDGIDVPDGWLVVHGEASRVDCQSWIEANWR